MTMDLPTYQASTHEQVVILLTSEFHMKSKVGFAYAVN
jgi:hypothetical protein